MGGIVPTYYKYSMVFKYTSGPPVGASLSLSGGWTESVYWNNNSTNSVNSFRLLCQARAALLPGKSYISGIRVQAVNPRGSAQTFPAYYPGGGNFNVAASDIPQMALLLRVRGSAVSNVRTMRITALPDNVVFYGEYGPLDSFFIASMNAYLSNLTGWLFQGRDLTIRPVNLTSIDASGNVTAQADVAVTQGQTVRISGARDSQGILRNGTFKVSTTTTLRLFQINGWGYGSCTLGTVTPYVAIYPAIIADPSSISRVVPRKIGRPSLGYRGRRSARRPRSHTVVPAG